MVGCVDRRNLERITVRRREGLGASIIFLPPRGSLRAGTASVQAVQPLSRQPPPQDAPHGECSNFSLSFSFSSSFLSRRSVEEGEVHRECRGVDGIVRLCGYCGSLGVDERRLENFAPGVFFFFSLPLSHFTPSGICFD